MNNSITRLIQPTQYELPSLIQTVDRRFFQAFKSAN
jgi:hypothetical protein